MPQWPCAVGLTDQSLGLPSGRSESDILVLLQSYNLSPQMLLALTPKPLFLQEVPKKGFDAAEETKWCLVSCSYKTCEEGYVEMYRVNMPGQLGPTSVVEAGSLLREFINLGANRLKVRHAQASNHNPPGSVSRGASTSAFLSLSSTGFHVFPENASLVNTMLALHLTALGESWKSFFPHVNFLWHRWGVQTRSLLPFRNAHCNLF